MMRIDWREMDKLNQQVAAPIYSAVAAAKKASSLRCPKWSVLRVACHGRSAEVSQFNGQSNG